MTMALNLLLIDDTSVSEPAMYPGIRKGGGGLMVVSLHTVSVKPGAY